MEKRNPKKVVVSFLFLVLTVSLSWGHSTLSFSHPIWPLVMRMIQFDANTAAIYKNKPKTKIRVEAPVTDVNVKEITVKGLAAGPYQYNDLSVRVELRCVIDKGVVSVDKTLEDVAGVVEIWDQMYGDLKDFKAYTPVLQQLAYRSGDHLDMDLILTGKVPYALPLEIPIKRRELGLVDIRDRFVWVKKFLKFLDKNKHAQTILQNNLSGRPATISVEKGKEGWVLFARHPYHYIKWDVAKKAYEYSYTDDYARVSKLKEVKQVSKHPKVREFLESEQQRVRFQIKGHRKTGFDVLVLAKNGSKKIKGKLIKRKFIVE